MDRVVHASKLSVFVSAATLFDIPGSCSDQNHKWHRDGDRHGPGTPETVRTVNFLLFSEETCSVCVDTR